MKRQLIARMERLEARHGQRANSIAQYEAMPSDARRAMLARIAERLGPKAVLELCARSGGAGDKLARALGLAR